MTGTDFQNFMQAVFAPFLAPLGFDMQGAHVSGRSYSAKFLGRKFSVNVSYEPAEGHTSVMLLTNGDRDLRSIDDPERSPRLADLNQRYMSLVSPAERSSNEDFFEKFEPRDPAERHLLKCAKELLLVLPRHLAAAGEG